MTKIGYACMLEQFHPTELLDFAEAAEKAGFDAGFQVSEHFHPWTPRQGQAAFAWSFMGALGERTSLPFGTAVTCPGFRYHPAVIAPWIPALPPESPLPAPRGTTGTRCAAARRTIAATSSVLRGRATASGRPGSRWRASSFRYDSRSIASVRSWSPGTSARSAARMSVMAEW